MLQSVKPAKPEQSAGQFDLSQVTFGLLVPANNQRTATGKPTECAFHDPATGRILLLSLGIEFLFPDAADVGRVPKFFAESIACAVKIAFV